MNSTTAVEVQNIEVGDFVVAMLGKGGGWDALTLRVVSSVNDGVDVTFTTRTLGDESDRRIFVSPVGSEFEVVR